jgi:tripartite-type tricarboxylate transporter receptor subunit TctC
MRNLKILSKLIFLEIFLFILLSFVNAVDYPRRAVEIIIPWSAGGATDLLFRTISTVFPKYSGGQPLIIRNIPGGGAVPGTMEFLRARPDGYTLFSIASPIIIKVHMSVVQFNADSFEPVIMLVNDPCYILVKADSPWKNLNDYIEYAKRNPEKVSIGNGGMGGGTHLAALAFEDFAKIKLLHVPFEGGGPAITALVGGHIDSYMGAAPEGLANVESGQLRILGVFGKNRLYKFKDIPTAKEQGINFLFGMWRGVAVPKGTPKEIVNRLHSIFYKAMNDPEFIQKARDLSLTLEYKGPYSFYQFIKDQDKFYENLIKSKKLGDRYK